MTLRAWKARGVTILVIEDDDDLAGALCRTLEAEGFEVERCANGRLGLDTATAGEYDLIILDLMLPGLNGYKICRTLRDAGDWTPILMLTAKAGEFDEAEGLETGADDYLVKPASMVVLVARVRALLRRPRRGGVSPQSGDLVLDPLRRRCLVAGHEVELTSRETELLAFLLDRAGTVVSKSEVLEGVWGDDFAGDPNIVEVYVSHLRRKVDEPFGRSTIQTVRGEGYRLRVESQT